MTVCFILMIFRFKYFQRFSKNILKDLLNLLFDRFFFHKLEHFVLFRSLILSVSLPVHFYPLADTQPDSDIVSPLLPTG